MRIAVSEPDANGHVWSAERCERCWCEPGWPLAQQPCPFRSARDAKDGVWEVDLDEEDGPSLRRKKSSTEEARARAREKQRERRAKMDPEVVRAQNRMYKQRQRERQRQQEREARMSRSERRHNRAA